MGGLWDEAGWACAAMVTPIDGAGRIDVDRLGRFGQRLMGAGLNGLVLFGTMGEGPAFPAAERLEAVAALIDRHGFDPRRLVLGIGSCAPAEIALMARQAGELRLAAVLATPPFFFRDVQQEGVYRFYATLAEAAGRGGGAPLLLYHIPQVTGVPLSADTVARLVEGHPEVVRGIKDSGADLPYTRALLERLDGRAAVLVGAEQHIAEAMILGARGTVCGMANLIPATTARLVAGDPEASAPVDALARAFDGLPVIPAVKAAVGEILGDPAWRACVPPLLPATDEQAAALVRHAEP